MEHPIYLTAADAAHVLGVTPATVRLMHRRGELALAAKTEGGVHLFSRLDVERAAAARSARGSARVATASHP